jgi:hypothetical protein
MLSATTFVSHTKSEVKVDVSNAPQQNDDVSSLVHDQRPKLEEVLVVNDNNEEKLSLVCHNWRRFH